MKKFPLEHLFNMIIHGKYTFHDFMNFDLEEEFSELKIKSRKVYAPSNKLKTFHHFINMTICEQLKINDDVVFSYRKGINTLDAVKAHKDSKYFFQTDIRSFYSSINKNLINYTLEKNKDTLPISDIDKYLERILRLVSVDDILPTGFSTSPLLSNSVLLDFDNDFFDYCTSNDLIYTRYSDDLIVSSKKKIDESLPFTIERFLNNHYENHFSLNRCKSRYSHTGQKIKILGMVILPNGDITIDKKQKKEIEVILHFYRHDKSKFRDIFDHDLDKGFSRISGILNYIKVIDEDYLHKLMTKYGVTAVDTLMRKAVHK